jgi:hypothetical protein
MNIKQILASMIEVDVETQARVGLSDETIAEYVAVIRDAQERGEAPPFPPVDLFFDGSRYYVGDGWHRILAWQQTTIDCIPAYVHDGGERDALLYAAGANSRHGLNRSIDDKWRAVEIMLADLEWAGWSDAKIAEHCHVSQPFVGKVRRKLQEDGTDGPAKNVIGSNGETVPVAKKRLGRDGKKHPAEKAGPKAPAEPAAEPGPNIETLAGPYKLAMGDLIRIKKELVAISGQPNVGAHLANKVVRITQPLDEARGVIRQSEPTAVCSKCGGEGCQHCLRTGFVTRFIADRPPTS